MGDAVLRVRGQLQSLARENWSALETQHVNNVSRLRDDLAQIARALGVKARFEHSESVAPEPFPRSLEDAFEVKAPARKKQRTEQPPKPRAQPKSDARLSMRLRTRSESVDVVEKRTRKRGRPSDVLLRDPGKLTVLELRAELKTRGMRTGGRKAELFDRLLDALEEEQQEDSEHLKKVVEAEEQQEDKQPVVIVIDDDDDDDEIVRESVGSNTSPHSREVSQATSSQAVEGNAKEDDVVLAAAVDGDEESHSSSPLDEEGDGEELQTGSAPQTEETPSTRMDAAGSARETESGNERVEPLASEKISSNASHGSKNAVEFAVRGAAEELITHDDLQLTRKSMQAGGKSELASPLVWKRKSILRKASSLAPSTSGTSRKVSFAPTDKVDVIVESSQTDSTQPDPSPEKTPQTPQDASKSAGFESTPGPEAKPASVTTPVTPSLSLLSPAKAVPEYETEEQRKKREFEESVAREALKLRAAAKLSAQKRLEEAKASKAFWAKRDQLKAKLSASSAGDKKAHATPVSSSSERPVVDHVSPPTSESSATTRERDSTPSIASVQTPSASKEGMQLPHSVATTVLDVEEAKDYDFMRSMARHHEVESISDVSSALDSSLQEPKAPRSTFSVVEEQHQIERSLPHRLADKQTAKSMPATAKEPTTRPTTRADVEQLEQKSHRPVHEPSFLSSKTLHEAAKTLDSSKVQAVEALTNRNRSDSLSSTVSSIPEPSVVENALKSGTLATATGARRPIANLVSGLHSFTTLLEKDTSSQDSNTGRSAPVVNALKLAERSRILEEQKQLEKEKRKALLKKKLEEHRKAAALKEKAEKDAEAKREQERLNERKKREAELARKRQQRVKEMRAGLEKKRAMLAAEKKAGHATNATMASKVSSTASSQQKSRGLASASGSSQPAAKSTARPLQKPVSKPVPKPVSKPAPVSEPAPQPTSKPAPKPALMSPQPVKHAPKSHSPEIVNYEMSDNAESSDGESSDSDSERHGKKKVPRWAQKDHLNKILSAQFGRNAIDPSPAIFQDFVDTCNLEAIFETTDIRKKKRFARRTSSGNWLADRPTARDRALYQRDMGYDR
ncbi:hypothetical protein PR003_g12863 [Phytophthora rubi]|uniref:SAP domain-containing protein n=1 Tax=Phytophthora rubi TaxID=129364 RepID=A0A6A3M601_9STRA|nr:hypothetical protein PR001_g12092 [Phytophthora rubi]KAE9335738.1 hypothetical protein PR003_g12863 [Phytophthora rubi]